MRILETAQGHGDSLEGLRLEAAVQRLTVADAEFLVQHPKCVPYFHPLWHEVEAHDSQTAPWGCIWWVVGQDGVLHWHSENCDSSD